MARNLAVSEIPQDWTYQLLDNVAERCSGHTPSKSFSEYWNGGIKWVSLTDSSNLDKGYIYETSKEISEQGIANSSAELHPAETVFLCRDAGIGKSGVMAEPMAVSQHFIAWKCDETKQIHSWFLYNWLRYYKKEFERQAVGSTIKTIGLPYFKKLKIALPSYEEQKKIAQILATWDKAITTTEQLLANSQQQKKSLMQQLLTGNKRLIGFNHEWKKHKLEDLFEFKKGKGISKSALSKDGQKCVLYGELYTKYGEVIEEVISRTESEDGVMSVNGDILIPASTTTTGIDLANATALNEGEVRLGGDINILRPKEKLNSSFFAYLITHIKKFDLASRAQGITIIHLYGKDLKSIEVCVPCDVNEQNRVAELLKYFEKEMEISKKIIEKLKQEKKALMQQLLTGKRRVKISEEV